MKFEELGESDRYSYVKKCPCCELDQVVFTQQDSYPEYYTNIYLRCQCGEYIHFELPVN